MPVPQFLGDGQDPVQIDTIDSVPPPPQSVRIRLVSQTPKTFQVTLRDHQVRFNARASVRDWQVRYVPYNLVAPGDSKLSIWAKGTAVASIPSTGRGREISTTVVNDELIDGYVLVAGISHNDFEGPPSEPALIRWGDAPVTQPPTSGITLIQVGTFGLTELTPGIFQTMLMLSPIVWTAPYDVANFAGWHLYVEGYNNSADLLEVDSLRPYTFAGYVDTTLMPDTIIIPRGQTYLGLGTGGLVNGSNQVTYVSGDAFAAPWDERRILFADMTTLEWGVPYRITSVGATLTLNNNFTDGPTGNYLFWVLPPMTFYAVPVTKSGIPLEPPTSAPSFSI